MSRRSEAGQVCWVGGRQVCWLQEGGRHTETQAERGLYRVYRCTDPKSKPVEISLKLGICYSSKYTWHTMYTLFIHKRNSRYTLRLWAPACVPGCVLSVPG